MSARSRQGLPEKKLGLSSEARLVTHVGNIRPGKGHDVLIDAAALLVEGLPDVTIVSIGGEKSQETWSGSRPGLQRKVSASRFASWGDDQTHSRSFPPLMSL